MFSNLKNKILEEVKASPQKFQQFAQAAQAAVSSASSNASDSVSGSDNFFSITEEDTPQNSPQKPAIISNNSPSVQTSTTVANVPPNLAVNNGPTISRNRKLSNSSVDSFRLPTYDSPAVYHLQSDLDISASEVEDSASTSSTRLDLISKEQLHDAYRRSHDRYQKYRARYTDLAKRYRDLERDSTKARQVLVETQDKAIRRISELREQCALEQQAKAHLEETLRMEMDDMQCKINAYQTKLKLLGENSENLVRSTENQSKKDDNLIQLGSDENNLIALDGENNQSVNGLQNEAVQSLKLRIVDLEQQLITRTNEIQEMNNKFAESDKIIDDLKKREEENAILLAQNKLMIHSELENKESEVKKLKSSLTDFETKFQQSEKENITLKKHIGEVNELEIKLKQITTSKQDIEAKLISSEHMLGELRKDLKEKEKQLENAKKTAEERLRAEYEEKVNMLRVQNEELNEMLQRSNKSEIELAQIDNELNRTKTENDALKETAEHLQKEKEKLLGEINECKKQLEKSDSLLRETQIREEDLLSQQSSLIAELEKSKNESLKFKGIADNYEQEIKKLEGELHILREQNGKTDTETIAALKLSLQQSNADFTEQLKALKNTLLEKENEISALKENLRQIENRLAETLKEKEENEKAMEKEKSELKSQVTNILQEIARMDEQMKGVKKSHTDLENEKRGLEKKIEKMTKQNQETQQGNSKSKTILKETEDKLKNVESENSQLAEKNCLLEEKCNRLEIQLKESESNFKKEKNALNSKIKETEENYKSIRLENEIANENIKKLNEKMSQVLDENSRLLNAKEIMEHEYRFLQDQLEEREKEKLCVIDSNKCLEEELQKLKEENISLTKENTTLKEISNNMRDALEDLNSKISVEKEKREKLQNKLKEVHEIKGSLENEVKNLQEKLKANNEEQVDGYRALIEENEDLKSKNKDLEDICENLRKELTDLNRQVVADISKWEKSYQEKVATTEAEIKALGEKLTKMSQENSSLDEQNQTLKKEIKLLKNKNESRLTELENSLKRTSEEKQSLKERVTDLEKNMQKYEELKIENEYLNTLAKQLEKELIELKEERAKLSEEVEEIREKLKSQQCELYVLSENQEKHNEEMERKSKEVELIKKEAHKLSEELESERAEAKRQMEHNNYITGQNDMIQKELLLVQTKLVEAEKLCGDARQSYEEILNENERLKNEITSAQILSKEQVDSLNNEIEKSKSVVNELSKELMQATKLLEKLQNVEVENQQLQERINALQIEIKENIAVKTEQTLEAAKTAQSDSDNLRKINDQLQRELEELKYKTSAQISNLTQELEDTTANSRHLSEKYSDYDKLKQECGQLAAELENFRQNLNNGSSPELNSIKEEKIDLEHKLNKIMHEVQDVSNRNLFLEQKCENYLILEQSNERLKLSNEKLSRQLDETLVSMHHNDSIQANTEFEYLRNIMFQYLTGTVNGNNETLVKVIAAVLKFSPQQTQVALEKEHQRHSLLGQINNLL